MKMPHPCKDKIYFFPAQMFKSYFIYKDKLTFAGLFNLGNCTELTFTNYIGFLKKSVLICKH